MWDQGARAVLSLCYLDRVPAFVIGQDHLEEGEVSVVAVRDNHRIPEDADRQVWALRRTRRLGAGLRA